MGQQINKNGIDFDTITYQRLKQPDGSFIYTETVTYEVQSDEENFARTRTRQLTGAVRTAVETRFTNATAALKASEGIP